MTEGIVGKTVAKAAELLKYERPGDVLRGAGHRDIRSIAKMANVKLGRLLKFYNDEVVLTEIELNRIENVLGLVPGTLYSKQKFYLLSEKNMSIVRHNLLTQKGYTGYCGSDSCFYSMPRTVFNGEQFSCKCGWVSGFPKDFMEQYAANKEEMR